ncbi:MAG: HAD-IA family hydrolase [Pseudomonadota bacterium]
MSLKFAIWDMDGTIIDSREIISGAMDRAFELCGLAPPGYAKTRTIVGLGLEEACRILAPNGFDDLARLTETYRQAFVSLRAEPGFKEPLYDGAEDLLAELGTGDWLLGVATGKSRRGVEAIFDMHPLKHHFQTVWCADDGPGKPHPFMVEEAMKAVGAQPDETLIIGDAIHDIAMGRAASIHTIGVSWGFGERAELEASGAHDVVDTFDALRASLWDFGKRRKTV